MKKNFTFLSIVMMCVSLTYGGSLQGTVRDANTLAPIAGVNVTVHVLFPDSLPFPTTSGNDGAYSIANIVSGNRLYTVVTHMSGYAMSYTRIDSLGSLDLTYDIYLTGEGITPPPGGPDSSTVLGTIMTPTAGTLTPIANAQVRLTSGSQQVDVTTSDDGKYTKTIPSGIYSFAVSADGYNAVNITGVQAQQSGTTVDAILQSSTTGIHAIDDGVQPDTYSLYNAYPNPFNPSTTISFTLPSRAFVSLKVYDSLGREIETLASGDLPAGLHSRRWAATTMPSGVYFSRLQVGNNIKTKKLVLLK